MRPAFVRVGLAAAATLLTMSGAIAGPGIPWAKTLPEAIAQARSSKKLVMVDFYTDW